MEFGSRFCSICTDSFDYGERRIHCQRCDLAFHQRCVQLNDIIVSGLDDDFGLFWFCSVCRMEFAAAANSSRKGGKPKLEEEGGEPSAAKRIRMNPSPRLPPEVWAMIFQHLDARLLAQVRLVCHDWNELVIARAELMDRFLLKLGTAQFVEDLGEVRHFLALGGGFTRAEFNCRDLGKDKPRVAWFVTLGLSLTTLTCKSIPFGFLYELLRSLPNLRRLKLDDCFEYGKSAKANYQLAKLEELTILKFKNKNHGDSIFPLLAHICPHIRVFKFLEESYHGFVRQIGSFIRAMGPKLQGLKLTATTALMNELVSINDMHLKRLTIDCKEEDLLRLIRRQPNLERLNFPNRVSTLDEISRLLPNLQKLKLQQVELLNPFNFSRAKLIRVRYVNSSDCVFGLACCLGTNLQRLELSRAYLTADALISLAHIAIHIEYVSFSGCSVERSSDIFSFVQQSKSLITFVIRQLDVKTVDDVPEAANGYSRIRHLKFCDLSKTILHALFELCPDVETLEIVHDLVEGDMIKMGQRLKRLKSLKLKGCTSTEQKMTIECLGPIADSFEADAD